MKRTHLLAMAVALAVLLAYANSFGNGFHFDDFHTVVDNPAIRSLANTPRFFTDATTFSVLPANRTWRPLVSTSLAFDYALARGYTPFWFHLTTFAVFLLTLGLLWLVAERAMNAADSTRPDHTLWAIAVAAWFGLHPAMAETVNYIIQRGDIFCTAGCLGALACWIRWPRLRRFGLYLLPLLFALLSKAPAAIFPALLLSWVFFETDAAAPTRIRFRTAALAALPSALLTIALMSLASHLTPKSFAPSTLSAADYLRTQPLVWLRYTGELLLPLHLNVDTDLSAFNHTTPAVLAGFAFVVLLLAAIAFTARRRRTFPIAFGLLWFVLTQLPTSLYPLSEVENDHRMFFSFPGLMLAVVWSLFLLRQHLRTRAFHVPRTALAALALFALTGYAWGTHLRNRVWRDEASLWRDNVAKSSRNGRGWMIYGLTRLNAGDYADALAMFNRALPLTPNYPTLEINLGVVHGALGHNLEAEAHFQRALALAPADDTTHAFYGRWLADRGRLPEAEAQLRQAIALNPQRPMQRDDLIRVLLAAGDTAAAQQAARDTLAVIPGDPLATTALAHSSTPDAAFWLNTSLAQYRAGQFAASLDSARHALALDPASPEAHNNLGANLAQLGHWDDAIHEEREALRLNPALTVARNNLALFTAHQLPASESTQTQSVCTQTAAALVNHSLAFDQQHRYTESIAAAHHALSADPHCAEAWNNIAAGEEALGHWNAAIAAAHHALALKPDFQLARNNLAWSEQQKRSSAH